MKYSIDATVYHQTPTESGWLIYLNGHHATEDEVVDVSFQAFWAGTATPPQSGDRVRVSIEWPPGQTIPVAPANEGEVGRG